TTPSTLNYADTSLFVSMARALAEKASVPIAIHLDHGNSYNLCRQAAEDGYTSLMIDGSKLPIEENISLSRQVVQLASAMSPALSVEAELGRLGGKEDAVEVKHGEDIYTDPDEAARFANETGVDSLAVAIGTAHGFYKGDPMLDFERLALLKAAVSIPLVLHGSSGVSDEDVRRAISLGVCKVNFATELRVAYTQAVRQCLESDIAIYDPKKYGVPARDAVTDIVRHRIRTCGAQNQA
ncbi:MAG: class II fructose-bisphosphate aldolase, partial [Oscillospiraceae bacterium]